MRGELEGRIAGARQALARLRRDVDAEQDREAVVGAIEELASMLEELDVTAQELQLQNDELAATQQELAAEERAYRELFELAPDAYLVTDPEGRVTESNESAAGLLGVPRHRLEGRLLVTFVAAAERPDFRHQLLAIGRGDGVRDWELSIRPRKNSAILVAADVEPGWSADGEVVALRWVLRDVTDARRAQHALQQAFTSATERYEHLREIDLWKDAFLAAAAHDLRAPLAVIREGARALARRLDAADEEVARTAGHIAAHADRLGRLLEDLLDLDRFTRGVITAERTPTDVLALIERIIERTDLGDRPVDIVGDPVTAALDAARVEQIVHNLLLNASKHTAPGTPVRVRVRSLEGGVELIVEDEGPGVPDEVRDDLFLPFVSAPTHDADRLGTGIGLSLVNLFSQLHGGEARVEDRDGGGARFVVQLPGALSP